jgi:hypothetical protein
MYGIKIPYLDNEIPLSIKLQLVDDKNASIEKLIIHGFLSDIFNFENMVYTAPNRVTNTIFNNQTASWIRIEIYDTNFENITEEYCFYNITLSSYNHPSFSYQSANPSKIELEFNFLEMEYTNNQEKINRTRVINKTNTEIYDSNTESKSATSKMTNYSNYQSQQSEMNKYNIGR